MSENEQRDSGLSLHRGLQWASTILTGLLVAFAVSGMETWDKLKDQSIRMESVPADIKEIKDDVSDISDDVNNVKYRVTNLETTTTKTKRP